MFLGLLDPNPDLNPDPNPDPLLVRGTVLDPAPLVRTQRYGSGSGSIIQRYGSESGSISKCHRYAHVCQCICLRH
jgi:hypothetical protein